MLDQSFSTNNFRQIFDDENRKGNNLEAKYFPSAASLSSDIKSINKSIRKLYTLKSKYSSSRYQKLLDRLKSSKSRILDRKHRALDNEFESLATSIICKSFEIEIRPGKSISGKPTFAYEDTPEAFFALKQVQKNIRRTYSVKQRDRHSIVRQLRTILSDRMPKHIIKLDIKSFYESIPRDAVLKKINNDRLLTQTSQRTISSILRQYGNLSGETKGLPRGVGISAFLSELYMRQFDSFIFRDTDLLYYARYVDDVIIIYSSDRYFDIDSKYHRIRKKLKKMQLHINKLKTECITNSPNYSFEYLGYKFNVNSGSLAIRISSSKLNRYKERLRLAFCDYLNNCSPYQEKKSRKLLIKRIKYLTGNTRLVNNKQHVCVGIHFSNEIVNDIGCFSGLDYYLTHLISTLSNPQLQLKLSQYSYSQGFKEKKFYYFNAKDLVEIVKGWPNAT